MPKTLIDTNRLNTADVEFVYDENGEEKTQFVSSAELEEFIIEMDYCSDEEGSCTNMPWDFLLDQFDYVTQEYWRLWS